MLDQNHSGSVVLRSVADVSRFIDNRPGSRGSILIVMIALGGVFVDAYDFTSLGIGVVQLKSEFDLSPLALGSVTAMMAFGAFLGALWGGYFTDRVGRLRMFLLDLLFLVVAAIGAALSVNLVMLLAFRFLMGVGVGLDFPVALSFIAEFVAEKRKGGNVNLWQVMWYVAASCTGPKARSGPHAISGSTKRPGFSVAPTASMQSRRPISPSGRLPRPRSISGRYSTRNTACARC